MLRKIRGPKRDEATGDWRKLHNEELNYLFSSPNIVRMIKWRGMGWAEHITRMERGELYRWFWWGYLKLRDNLKDPGVDEGKILQWILRKWDVGYEMDQAGSR